MELSIQWHALTSHSSDIVAELPCPHSGILTYEEDMPHPNFKTEEDGKDNDIVHSYIGQLFLRKHLNQLHNMFYRPDGGKHFPYIEDFTAY